MKRIFRSLRQQFRLKRYNYIEDQIRVEETDGLVLDLGGGPASFFSEIFPRPQQILLVDILLDKAVEAKERKPELNVIVADASYLPLAKRSIDITISNSVIEHVDNPERMALEIERVSQNYFLQTPNGDFPLETHSFIALPFYNYLKWEFLKKSVCKVVGANYKYISTVRYLSEQQLRNLFPNAVVSYEKFLGLKKSFYVSLQRQGDS